MALKKSLARPFIAGMALVVGGCGADTNINQIWGKDQAADTLLAEAKAAYDAGKFNEAEKLALQIVNKSPDHEVASILLGYVYLSQGGLDPYRVASCLIELSDDSTAASAKATKTSKCQSTSGASATFAKVDGKVDELLSLAQPDLPATAESSFDRSASFMAESESSGDVTDTLRKLQDGLLNVSDEDFLKLQEKEFQGSSTIFKGETKKLLIPKKVTEDLRNNVFVLSKMNQVVKTICRFVNEDADIRADTSRYKALNCAVTSEPRSNAAKAHYLWAIAHLSESLVYQSVLLYDKSPTASSNIQGGAEALNTFSGDLIGYVNAVTDLKDALDQVFDTADSSSMISACLNDLTSVNGAFAAIAGLPAGVKQQLSKIMDNIRTIAKSIGGTTTQADQTKALKTQMTEKITQKVGSQTNETVGKLVEAKTGKKVDPNTVTSKDLDTLDATNKTQVQTLCTTYDNLSKDMPKDKQAASKPKACT